MLTGGMGGGLKIIEPEVERMNVSTCEGLIQLLSRLVGQEIVVHCEQPKETTGERCARCGTCRNLAILKKLTQADDWSCATLNQALLLLNQPTVTDDFFTLFFARKRKGGRMAAKDLKEGVVFFRGLAMLKFGNFRFAYKNLASKHRATLIRNLSPYILPPELRRKMFSSRLNPPDHLEPIEANKRWCLGHISASRAVTDATALSAINCLLGRQRQDVIEAQLKTDQIKNFRIKLEALRKRDLSKWKGKKTELDQLEESIARLLDVIKAEQERGERNTSVYLSRTTMDVYVATSMREPWEFAATYEFVRAVFDHPAVKNLNLLHFDPTLSFTHDRIDKGLTEGLMLKQAECTLYQVQETDTLGKDSELASTLAQGKSVIAFVPDENKEQIASRIRSNGLRFVMKRLMLLMAEEVLIAKEELESATAFLAKAGSFAPFFRLVGTEEKEFLNRIKKEWANVESILPEAERAYMQKRADTLASRHPLAMQVHLESGVANGVLVVRSPEKCAELLSKLLTNECAFTILHEQGAYILREEISQCPFRVVTDDPMLTNSFWSLYTREEAPIEVDEIWPLLASESDEEQEHPPPPEAVRKPPKARPAK